MRYVSIDIETSGLEPTNHKTLSIGAIIEDTENPMPFEDLPKFHIAIAHREINGSPFALSMNRELIQSISEYHELRGNFEEKKQLEEKRGILFVHEDEASDYFYRFLVENGFETNSNSPSINSKTIPIKINVAGKNFATFDKLFLEQLPKWKKGIRISQRILDPAILCVDWIKDEALPSLYECKKRTNINGEVTHNALEDAWDVIQILRHFY